MRYRTPFWQWSGSNGIKLSCEQCRATFEALDASDDPPSLRALRLDEVEPGCRCEAVSVSEHSPGIVEGRELLIRIVVAPQHVNGKGVPKAAALSDAERCGLSILRQEHAEDAHVRSIAEGLVARARKSHNLKAGVVGVLLMECETVRRFTRAEEEPRCYGVYDTALSEIPGHGEVFQTIAGVEDGIRDDRRNKLFAKVKESFVPVTEFRGGLLADLAPTTR